MILPPPGRRRPDGRSAPGRARRRPPGPPATAGGPDTPIETARTRRPSPSERPAWGAAAGTAAAPPPGPEANRLALPEPDLMIYLDLPAEISAQMLRLRQEATHTRADIHEQDGDYLRACRESARDIAGRLGWKVVDCSRAGAMRAPEDIHEELWALVRPLAED